MCKESMHSAGKACIASWISSAGLHLWFSDVQHTHKCGLGQTCFSAHCITAVTFTRSLRLWRSSLLRYMCQIFQISCVTTATNTHSCSERQYVRVKNGTGLNHSNTDMCSSHNTALMLLKNVQCPMFRFSLHLFYDQSIIKFAVDYFTDFIDSLAKPAVRSADRNDLWYIVCHTAGGLRVYSQANATILCVFLKRKWCFISGLFVTFIGESDKSTDELKGSAIVNKETRLCCRLSNKYLGQWRDGSCFFVQRP